MGTVHTFQGPLDAGQLGAVLIHEHLFVRNQELEVNLPDAEWDPEAAIETAANELRALYELGIETVVDLTVPGLGRDIELVARVAERAPVNLVASTGWYTPNALPTYFRFHGPGLSIDGPDPLIGLFVRDITEGIAGTTVRASMLKVMTDVDGITPDVGRVMAAAAAAHAETGVAITTHSHPGSRNGLDQLAYLRQRGVRAERVVIGHSGDSEDLDYLRAIMAQGATIGMDRFGMEHVLPDERRVRTVLSLLEEGYGDRMVLSHDAAVYSHVTPPSWRAANAPRWRMDTISRHILPALRASGVSDDQIDELLVRNPRRLLEVGT